MPGPSTGPWPSSWETLLWVHRNEIANKLAKERTVHQFVVHELALQVSRQNMIKR
jgi:hypothetical protein